MRGCTIQQEKGVVSRVSHQAAESVESTALLSSVLGQEVEYVCAQLISCVGWCSVQLVGDCKCPICPKHSKSSQD